MNSDEVGLAAHPIHDLLAIKAAPLGNGVVVDLGCGSGHTLVALQRRWPGIGPIGIDLSATALEAARQTGVFSRLTRADLGTELPLRHASVDVSVCHNVIELLPDPVTLFAEARRVLRPGGRAIWSHTDFAGLLIHGADEDLTAQVRRAYADIPQQWMAHIDPYAGRKIPALARRAGLTVDAFDAHTLAANALTGHARRRIDEISEVVCRHARQLRTDLTEVEVMTWRTQLEEADERGQFCFAETTLITSSLQPNNRTGSSSGEHGCGRVSWV